MKTCSKIKNKYLFLLLFHKHVSFRSFFYLSKDETYHNPHTTSNLLIIRSYRFCRNNQAISKFWKFVKTQVYRSWNWRRSRSNYFRSNYYPWISSTASSAMNRSLVPRRFDNIDLKLTATRSHNCRSSNIEFRSFSCPLGVFPTLRILATICR